MKVEPRRAMYMAVCAMTGAAGRHVFEMCNGDVEAMECVDKAMQALAAHLYETMTERWKIEDDQT